MATKSRSIEEYLQRRVSELLNQNWPEHDIIQQLEAVVGRKAVAAEIAKQKVGGVRPREVGITPEGSPALTKPNGPRRCCHRPNPGKVILIEYTKA
jgi:hypothetical protein